MNGSLKRETLVQIRWKNINNDLIPVAASLGAGVLTAYCLGLNPTVATVLNINMVAIAVMSGIIIIKSSLIIYTLPFDE